MAVALLTPRAPETATDPEEPAATVLEVVKLNVPMPVMALVSRLKIQEVPDAVKVATSKVEPTTRDDKVAPRAGPDVTLTWLSCMPAQVAGMPVHVKLKVVRLDTLVALTEKL
jgi:hypothetical protein